MSNPLHNLYIQAEEAVGDNSLLTLLGNLDSRYEFMSDLHEEGKRKFSKQLDLSSGREVVLVQLYSEDKEEVKKFTRERQISLSLQHPGIVPHYDAGKDETGLFFTRKWLNEKSLQQRLQEKERIWTKAQSLRIILQILEALNYAHTKSIYHGNLKAEKIFISESGNVYLTDWSKAVPGDQKLKVKDIQDLGGLFLSIVNLCQDFEIVPSGLRAVSRKACRSNGGYESIAEMMDDIISYRDGYVPKAEKALLLKSVFQFFKRNPLFSLTLFLSLIVIIFLSSWFFSNLKDRQQHIDKNLKEAVKKKAAADKALKEFVKENELRKEIALEAAEAHAAVARASIRTGDIDKAREMASIAWQLSQKEKFTNEVRAHLAFIDQQYDIAEQSYTYKEFRYFEKILTLTRKYRNQKPDIKELLADYKDNDRKELTIYSVNRLLFLKNGTEFKKEFIRIIKHFNPGVTVKLELKKGEGSLTVDFSGSRNIKTLEFMLGMPVDVIDIRNTGITDVDLKIIPQLKKVIFNNGQNFEAGKNVERIEQ